MEVGVRDLKARLSAYLKRAAADEVITVTDRGRPVAVLGPPPGQVDLDAATAAGWLTRSTTRGPRPVRRHPPLRPVQDVLVEDRTE